MTWYIETQGDSSSLKIIDYSLIIDINERLVEDYTGVEREESVPLFIFITVILVKVWTSLRMGFQNWRVTNIDVS